MITRRVAGHDDLELLFHVFKVSLGPYIAQTYGEAKLVELYQNLSSGAADLRGTLGVDLATFTAGWANYVERARTSALP